MSEVPTGALKFMERYASLKRREKIGNLSGLIGLGSSPIVYQLLGSIPATEMLASRISASLAIASFAGLWIATIFARARHRMVVAACDTQDKSKLGILLDRYRYFGILKSGQFRAEGWHLPRIETEIETTYAIQCMLPAIEGEDSLLLDFSHREVIRELLSYDHPHMVRGAIYAISMVGDESDARFIDRMIQKDAESIAQFRQEAEEAIKTIRVRLSRADQAAELMRASTDPAAPAEELVRSAGYVVQEKRAEELLRADNIT